MNRIVHSREEVVRLARAWIRTPYHHQASVRGAGCDCLGLVRGVFRELYGREPQDLPPYTRDWVEAGGGETMLDAATRHLRAIDEASAHAGDVVIFRLRAGYVAKHAAILTGEATMVHAMESAPVAEVPLGRWWRRRIAGAFAFPGTVR
jgi:NlpC/P60 family putative phage cell wall peptidase